MTDRTAAMAVGILAAISLSTLILWLSTLYVERVLRRWAADKGYELSRWHRAWWPWQGPRAWHRWRHQADYRVEIVDRRGARGGWLMFDWPIFGVGRPRIRAWWDGCMPEYEPEFPEP